MIQEGELHLFVSYAPGVGKSYQMLKFASEQEAMGRIVKYASVFEGHRDIDYEAVEKGYSLSELILTKPDIVVLDELTLKGENRENPDRAIYEDVDELLHQGICVCSTVNMMAFDAIDRCCGARTGFHRKQLLSEMWLQRAHVIYFVDMEIDALYENYDSGKLFPKTGKNAVTDLIFDKANLEIYREEAIRYLQDYSNVVWLVREEI